MLARLLPFFLLVSFTSCTQARGVSVSKVTRGGMLYNVITLNPARDRLELHWLNPTTGQPYRTFNQLQARLAKEGKTLLFATNSGIYAPGLKPLGLHVQKGEMLVPINNARSGGNFALLPNGVFWLKGTQAGITETQAYRRNDPKPDYATQSGPLLVQKGEFNPQFNKNSTSFKLRSGVGVCQDGKVRFVISAGAVTFYQFAVFFRDYLKCPDALYLDGSISAYYTPSNNSQLIDFAGIWGVSK